MSTPVVVLQITDLHILADSHKEMAGVDTEQSFKQILKQAYLQHRKIDCILVTGDLAQNPCQSSYQRIAKELARYNTRTICLPGNHDDFSLMQQYLNSAQVNCDKQLILKGWQIISLNSKKEADQGGYLETKELDFLDEQLKSHAHLHTVIAVHHHPVPTKSLWMDKMIIKNNDQLFTLLLKYPQVKAITCGHIHQQLDISENNIRIYGSPATCFQFKPECREYTLDNKKPGYRIVKLYEDSSIQSNIYRIENVS